MISFGSEDTLIVDPLLQSTAYRAPYSWKMSYHYCTSLRSQAVRFIDSPPNTDIEWLSIMQHHAPDSAAIRLNGNVLSRWLLPHNTGVHAQMKQFIGQEQNVLLVSVLYPVRSFTHWINCS